MASIRDYLEGRRLNPSLYPSLTISEQEREITLLLWNLSGQLVGHQLIYPDRVGDQKYDTHVTKPHLGTWGLESWDYSPGLLFLTEGVFDACQLHNLGYSAIAVLGSSPVRLRSWLFGIGRVIVSAGDGDKAGKLLNRLGDFYLQIPEREDLGSLPEERILELIKPENWRPNVCTKNLTQS